MPITFPDRNGCDTETLRTDVRDIIVPHVRRRTITATVGTSETTIAHGLNDIPTWIGVIPRADARVWRSSDPDKDFIRLTASVSCTVDIEVSSA